MPKWKPFQQRQATRDEIEGWTRQYRPSCYAVVTGAVSALVVLDFDGDAGARTMRQMGLKPHLETPSGGFHCYFEHPGHRVPTLNSKSKRELGDRYSGLDIRADGGYAIFYGNGNHGTYKPLRDLTPDPLNSLPADMRRYLGLDVPPSKSAKRSQPAMASTSAPPPGRVDPQTLIQEAIELGHSKGRNNAGFWLACQLRDNGYRKAEARHVGSLLIAALPDTNTKGQREPYTAGDFAASVHQAFSAPPREPWAMPTPEETHPRPAAKSNTHSAIAGEEAEFPTGESVQQLDATGTGTFELRKDGLYWKDLNPAEPQTWLSSPLRVTADLRNQQNRGWSRLVQVRDRDGIVHRVVIPRTLFAGDETELRKLLLDAGADLRKDKKNPDKLSQYLRTAVVPTRLRSVSRIGWHDSTYILPDCEFPKTDTKQFFLEWPQDVPNQYTMRGTLSDWVKHIGQIAAGNSRLVLAICTAFAGPLLKPLGIIGGGIHLKGDSSLGKTTALMTAGSVIGGGGKQGFGHSWKATINALEPMCEAHNDSTLILDEIRQADPYRIVESAYMLANGIGKARQTKTLYLRSTAEWTTVVLSSGEEDLEQIADRIGSKVPAGALVRFPVVPADAGAGRGIFSDLHSAADGATFSNQLREAAKKYFGVPIRAFLERLVHDRPSVEQRWPQFRDGFAAEYVPKGAGEELGRVAQLFALVAYAGTLATEWHITGWTEEEAYRAIGVCFTAHCKYRGSVGPSDIERGIAHVRMVLEQYGSSRFAEIKTAGGDSGTAHEDRIQQRYGYRKQQADGATEYWVFREVWRTEFCKGLDHEAIARALAQQGHLVRNEAHLTSVRRVPGVGRPRFYVLRDSILTGEPSGPREQTNTPEDDSREILSRKDPYVQ